MLKIENPLKEINKSRKRIVYLNGSASGYGGEVCLYNLVTHLPKEFEPIVILPENGPLVEKLKIKGIKIIITPFAVLQKKYFHSLRIFGYISFLLFSIIKFFIILKKQKPDLVHTNTSQVIPGAIVCKFLKIPHIWHIREIPKISLSIWTIWMWYILTFSDKVICMSNAVKERFGKNKKVIVIYEGIETSLFKHQKTGVLKQYGIKNDEKTACLIGRINYWKGQDLFIEAANLVLKKRKNIKFLIVGDARKEYKKLEENLYRIIKHYKIEKNIIFTGYLPREKIPEILNAIDILVLASKQPEPFGLVILEAMACEKPVIAPAEGGPLDIILNGVSGILVEPRNPQKIAEAIIRLLNNERLKRKIEKEARIRIEAKFRLREGVFNIIKVYKEVLNSRKMVEERREK